MIMMNLRTTLAFLILGLIIVVSGILLHINTLNYNLVYYPRQALTEQEISTIIDIALNDPYVNEKITSWKSYEIDYRTGNVSVSQYVEAYANNRTRTLPSLELIAGSNESGVRLYAFVDLNEDRVAYIGYVNPVQYNVIGQQKYYYNTTIINTGFKLGQNITESQKSKAIQLALSNETVKRYINGSEYEVHDIGLWLEDAGPSGQYIVVYPNVPILVTGTNGEYYLYVGVNTNSDKVLFINTMGYNRPCLNRPESYQLK
jgi:hypothetical protein